MKRRYENSFPFEEAAGLQKLKRRRDIIPPITEFVCGKRGFPSYKLAKRRLKQGWQRTMREAAPYRCPECSVWHVGNPNRF